MNSYSKFLVCTVLLLPVHCAAGPRATAQARDAAPVLVDSGSFGIFQRGQRIATESFRIQESGTAKVVSSRLTARQGAGRVEQTIELRLSPAGDLISYEWRESAPGSAMLIVVPQDEFLSQRSLSSQGASPEEQAFLLPHQTAILDHNFFVLREVLAWRYLAENCKTVDANDQCLREPGRIPSLVPQDRASVSTVLKLVGMESIAIGESDHNLLHLALTDGNGRWDLWLDPGNRFKLVRILAADGSEVLRD
jgi:hypothetical protein